MPFKSDKQRKYLWSQKPEVAKQIAHKNMGGTIWDMVKPVPEMPGKKKMMKPMGGK